MRLRCRILRFFAFVRKLHLATLSCCCTRKSILPPTKQPPMEPQKIRLTKEKETYLATLYGKALDAAADKPILGDRFAADAVARIDFDFKKLKLPGGGEITLPLRALHFDQWTRAFLAANSRSTVL